MAHRDSRAAKVTGNARPTAAHITRLGQLSLYHTSERAACKEEDLDSLPALLYAISRRANVPSSTVAVCQLH